MNKRERQELQGIQLSSVIISNSVTTIGDRAFMVHKR